MTAHVPVTTCAPSQVELSDGSVLTAWFGGSAEGARDVSIMSARRLPSGGWSTPRRIARVLEGFQSHWNPVLFFNADRSKLWLHFKVRPPSYRDDSLRGSQIF